MKNNPSANKQKVSKTKQNTTKLVEIGSDSKLDQRFPIIVSDIVKQRNYYIIQSFKVNTHTPLALNI